MYLAIAKLHDNLRNKASFVDKPWLLWAYLYETEVV